MTADNRYHFIDPDEEYERLLVRMARLLYEYINSINDAEALQILNESQLIDGFLDAWDNHKWYYLIDYIDDLTMNLGEGLVLKIEMLKPSKREIRENTAVPIGVVEKFAEDVRLVIEALEKELGITVM